MMTSNNTLTQLSSSNNRVPLSPMSVAGSEWSGISSYKSPPESMGAMSRNGSYSGPGTNTSPPSSIARSSDGNGLYSSMNGQDSPGGAKQRPMPTRMNSKQHDEQVASQHAALKRLLEPYLSSDKNLAKVNKARDKLLRLTGIQFQELSTDVYDELQRRQGAGDRLSSATNVTRNNDDGSQGATPFLLPKPIFHPKRNQARQKLSTLPSTRFRDLATDVFYELERRFPQFTGGSISRVGSPAGSMNRSGSPSSIDGRSPGGMNGRGGLGVPGAGGSLGRPLPKTLQSNTVIPNKSTMMEEGDDENDDEDDEDAFGLDDRFRSMGSARKGPGTSGRDSMNSTTSSVARNGTSNDADRKLIADYQSQVSTLQQKIEQYELNLNKKDYEIKGLRDDEQHLKDDLQQLQNAQNSNGDNAREMQNLKADLDGKLAEAQNLNTNLQNELARIKSEQSNKPQQRGFGGEDDGYREMYEELSQKHDELKMELADQQEVTEEVRKEAMTFLSEMRTLSETSDQAYKQQEVHLSQIAKLNEEVKEWRSRYTKTRTQLRSLRSQSIGLPGAIDHSSPSAFSSPNGLVKDIQVTRFQVIIDELLRTARYDPKQTLNYMRSIVVATKAITKNVETGEQTTEVKKLRTRVSATANNLVTAIRNHSMADGMSPVSLVDAAASHLTAAVMELVRSVKVRPTPVEELDAEDEDEVGLLSDDFQMDNGNGNNLLRSPNPTPGLSGLSPARTSIDSVYSSSSMHDSPRFSSRNASGNWGKRAGTSMINPLGINQAMDMSKAPAFGIRTEESDVEELKNFLITQTNGVIESIQKLLQELRADDSQIPQLRGYISDIVLVVGKVVQSTQTSMSQTGNSMLRDKADWIVKSLAECREKMIKMEQEGEGSTGRAEKEYSSRLAGHCFAMARETKELVRIVEEIDNDGRENSDSLR